jgi:hypothetical protein
MKAIEFEFEPTPTISCVFELALEIGLKSKFLNGANRRRLAENWESDFHEN